MIRGAKDLMNNEDKNILENLKFYKPELFKKEKLYFNDNNDYVGLGWSHNFNKEGVWSEGESSNLLFNLKTKEKIFFEMDILPFLNKKNREINITVLVNGKFNNNLSLKLDENLATKKRQIIFEIKKENINNDIINIEFINKNPTSPFDLRLSPDSRQLNFLLLSFNFFSRDI